MTQLSVAATRTGSGEVVSDEQAEVTALGLSAGADAATVDFKDGLTGAVRWRLVAPANTSVNISFKSALRFTRSVYAETTGTSPVVSVAVKRARANQV